jgi:predicted DNA-binding transcriptional regulator AlpA
VQRWGAALGALQTYGAVGSVGERVYSLTLSTKGGDREAAKLEAAKALRQAVAAGLPDWPIASMVAQPAGSNLPALVGTPQVARILGVNPERVRELARLNETFPAPAGRVGRNRVWTEESIRAWQASWPRKAGRPRKVASS